MSIKGQTSKKAAPIPTCRATTAYGWLSFVRQLILDEPKRYHQSTYIARRDGAGHADDPEADGRQMFPGGLPACGTVGCVAGWVATLSTSRLFSYFQTEHIARRVLGLSEEQSHELFDGGALHTSATPQSAAYARVGARHIAAFQKKYAKQLKATKVRRRQA